MEQNSNSKKSIGKMLLPYLLFFFLGLTCLFRLSYLFLTGNWEELTVDEILFHVFAPMGGANGHLVQLFITTALIPSVLLWLFLSLFYFFFYQRKLSIFSKIKNSFLSKMKQDFLPKMKKAFLPLCAFASLFLVGVTIAEAWEGISLGAFLSSQFQSSGFIEEHYVDPKNLDLKFPEKKRNLIYIYMESTELTFMDKEHGGAFPENLLPELMALGEEGEDFAGEGGRETAEFLCPDPPGPWGLFLEKAQAFL